MNNRIQELALKAGLQKPHSSDREYLGNFDWRLFAELIVEEFINNISKQSDDVISLVDDWDRGYVAGLQGAVSIIKEHFEVEEPQGWICSRCGVDRTKVTCPNSHHAALTGHCPMVGVAQ